MSVTDAELGAALRKIAMAMPRRDDRDPEASFDYYARTIVRCASEESIKKYTARRLVSVKVLVSPSQPHTDGIFELLGEMLSGEAPTGAIDPFDTDDLSRRVELLRETIDGGQAGDDAERLTGQIEGISWVIGRAVRRGERE